MTRFRQMLHVAAKDLRLMRWTLAIYAVVLAVSAAVAIGWPRITLSGIRSISNLVIPFGICLAAMFVQSDSPSRADAFWATRPLSAGAVAASKVLATVVGLILPGLIAQLAVIASFNLSLADSAMLVAQSAVFYALLLVIAMVLAVFTPDLKTFLATLAVCVFSFFVLGSILPDRPIVVPSVFSPILQVAPVVFIVFAVAHQYATRDTRRSRGIALAAGLTLFGLPRLLTARSSESSELPAPTASGLVRLIDTRIETRVRPNRIVFRMAPLLPSDSDRTMLLGPQAYVMPRTGRPQFIETAAQTYELTHPGLIVDATVRWLAPQTSVADTTIVAFNLTDGQSALLARGDATVLLVGEARVDRAHFLEAMPIRPGARIRVPRYHFQVDSSTTWNGPQVDLRVASVESRPFEFWDIEHVGFVAVNPTRHEAVRMRAEIEAGGGSSPMPLPGVNESLTRMSARLETDDPRTRPAEVTDTWLRGAELHLFGWTTVREERVSLSATPVPVRPTDPIDSVRHDAVSSTFVRSVPIQRR